MAQFEAKLDVLPDAQRRLWLELGATPKTFVLYGGTALALRLSHRTSEDFDFFSSSSFAADDLMDRVPYLKGGRIDQFQENTLTCTVEREDPVKVSFFGGLADLRRVNDPDTSSDNEVQIASMLDIAAMKMSVIQRRAAYKDYFDIDALLRAGIELRDALAAAQAVYGKAFNPMVSLKALSFFADGDLYRLERSVQKRLLNAARAVEVDQLPRLTGKEGLSVRGLEQ
ncbi:MAG: nucleotidyl transferase AbiEii/AbiGii toxin family protein [Acidobacteriota bacterium]|nr:nucleotidyl transferase AbiEii/AbiGii toxin family protein [Acidobacteriota bacterium]